MIKTVILLLVLLMLLSLAFAWRSVVLENSQQMRRWLWLRILLALLIMAVLIYGSLAGHIPNQVPWQFSQ